MAKLEGKAALVTGGASGIGEAVVRLFIEEGARVVIADIDEARGGALAEELGAQASFVAADVTRAEAVEAAVAETVERFAALDILVNNADMFPADEPIDRIAPESFDRTMSVLVRSVFLGMKYAAPVMQAQQAGSIVNTASVAGLMPGARPHIYAAAKAAVIQLTRSVAQELGSYGIRVNCVCPGPVATRLYTQGMSKVVADYVRGALGRVFEQTQPLPRAGQVTDVARAVLWLASEDASFVTGDALVVDGGLSCQQWSVSKTVQESLLSGLGGAG